MKILVTGAAGFIGFHLTLALINRNDIVIGIDNLNNYYDPLLKKIRLDNIVSNPKSSNFQFIKADISDRDFIEKLFTDNDFDVVVNLAAQAGVRHSLKEPYAYMESNMVGFLNILEGCRNSKIKHLVYASSSSVYGMNIKKPFSVGDNVDYPISLYAASKRSNELMAYSYSHLYKIPSTGLRFFTVYGPYGRPDMAYFKFTKDIFDNQPIDVYNNGEMNRDFTYSDDVIEGIIRVIDNPPIEQSNKNTASLAPTKIINIGNNKPITLKRFIKSIEIAIGKKAKKNLMPMQLGDVPITFADIDPLIEEYMLRPTTSIENGIKNFVAWFSDTYRDNK